MMASYRKCVNRTFLCGSCLFLAITLLTWRNLVTSYTPQVPRTGYDVAGAAYGVPHDHSAAYGVNLSNIAATLAQTFPRIHGTDHTDFEEFQLNVTASEAVGAVRAVPDTRPAGCQVVEWGERLPAASIIIPFHDEAWSVLVRTVHSVLSRTPRTLLREIILVDDASSRPALWEPLAAYIRTLGGVLLIRSKERLGLIRARLLGAKRACGAVLVFVDAHVEVGY